MKYLIIPEDADPWVIDCDPSELKEVVEELIKKYEIHHGDKIYECSYIGIFESKTVISFNFKS